MSQDSQPYRIKQSEVKDKRLELYTEQGSKCALCKQPITESEQALDHCHKTGRLRGTLHRGCNALLGQIENNIPRNKLTNTAKLAAFLRNLIPYISQDYTHHPLHYTHRTEDEKRIRRNLKARKARAAKKEL